MAAPPPQTVLNTYQALLTTFSDFLVVAIHTILYERGIYPTETFISARRYNFPVRQNRHPKVCKWVADAAAAVEAEMLKGAVRRVAVVIFSQDSIVLERFMFDVESFPEVPLSEALTPFHQGETDADNSNRPDLKVSLVDIEEQLRATIRKLAYCGSKLRPLPDGCTFTVAVELKDRADPPIGHPQPWVPSEPSLQTGDKGHSARIGSDLGGIKSIPVRSVETGEFVLEMWIEEGKGKEDVS